MKRNQNYLQNFLLIFNEWDNMSSHLPKNGEQKISPVFYI